MSDELKPCPYCGSAPKYLYNPAYDVHCVWCANKRCEVRPDKDSYVSKEDAVTAWNTRPIEDALRAELAAIPWAALRSVIERALRYRSQEWVTVWQWLRAHAPQQQEAQEAQNE